jgi:hypothetical protein
VWRVLLVCALVLVVLVGGGTLAAVLYVHSVDSNIKRVDAFAGVPAGSRPSKAAPDAMNLLILGGGSRDPANLTGSRWRRTTSPATRTPKSTRRSPGAGSR